MRLVYKYILNDEKTKAELLRLCNISKCLYNQALYVINQSLKNGNGFLSYYDLDDKMKLTVNLEGQVNYRLLKAQVA